MNFKEMFLKHLEHQKIKFSTEEDGDDFIVGVYEKAEVDFDGLRAVTFCFNKVGELVEVWHGVYKGKYEDLTENKDDNERLENEKIGESLKLIASGINSFLKKRYN